MDVPRTVHAKVALAVATWAGAELHVIFWWSALSSVNHQVAGASMGRVFARWDSLALGAQTSSAHIVALATVCAATVRASARRAGSGVCATAASMLPLFVIPLVPMEAGASMASAIAPPALLASIAPSL